MSTNKNNKDVKNDFDFSEEKTWFSYVEKNRPQAPENFNNTVWENIKKKNKKHRLNTVITLAAACIVLTLSILTLLPKQKVQSDEEKMALLLEARSMIKQPAKATEKNILYEDNTIRIYTTITH